MEDRKLTEHFSLFELTETNREEFQKQNREVSDNQVEKLALGAKTLLEPMRDFLGVPILVHSGYRCAPLNKAVGSSDRSQHLLCEAFDCEPRGLEIGNAFRLLWKQVLDGKLNVGQLIFETAKRQYKTDSWIHISMGEPWRSPERCNQILRMIDGKYEFLSSPHKEAA